MNGAVVPWAAGSSGKAKGRMSLPEPPVSPDDLQGQAGHLRMAGFALAGDQPYGSR